MRLFLDDLRQPWKHGYLGAEWVKTAADAIAMLKTGRVTFASLDHDLKEEHYPWNCKELPPPGDGTGFDVVLFLKQNPHLWPADGVHVHSANAGGTGRMLEIISNHYGKSFQ